MENELAALEAASGTKIGVFLRDTANNVTLQSRSGERFPFCSTFKVMLVAAVLEQSRKEPGIMQQYIPYTQKDLVSWSPVTEKHITAGMTVAELSAAALQFSDNTATNLLLRLLGGPDAVTSYARSIGDSSFTLNRWEPDLNTVLPGDERDTTTPAAMGESLRRLVLGDTLPLPQREQLQSWLRGNTTGDQSIRAGVPAGWVVGDKTGSGAYGTTNDIAVLWPPAGEPLILVIYLTHTDETAPNRKDILVQVTRLLVQTWQTRTHFSTAP
ncbi:beta-lactamase [Betaproteobacteria bacterium]|nr:beta-lactamase [Betaproteobacteria bacterium]